MKKYFFILILLVLFTYDVYAKIKIFSEYNVKIEQIGPENIVIIEHKKFIISPKIKIVNKEEKPINFYSLKKGDVVDIKYKIGDYSELFPYPNGSKVIFFIKKKDNLFHNKKKIQRHK